MRLPPILIYTVLRLLFFLVPLGLMMLLPIFRENWLLAAIFAAVIGLALSMLLLNRPLGEVSSRLLRRRQAGTRVTDEDVEDAEADRRASSKRGAPDAG